MPAAEVFVISAELNSASSVMYMCNDDSNSPSDPGVELRSSSSEFSLFIPGNSRSSGDTFNTGRLVRK